MQDRGVVHTWRRRLLWTGALSLLLVGLVAQIRAWREVAGAETCGLSSDGTASDTTRVHPAAFRVLLFTRHTGYSHQSIPTAEAAIRALGARHGFSVASTDDARLFQDSVLREFAAVIFLNTTGNILSQPQKAAFERYVHAGGGIVGIHSALDTESGWAWYHRLLGADFVDHSPIQRARLIVAPAPAGMPAPLSPWERTDEWYNYRALPQGVQVLVSVDEGSYHGGKMGRWHPVTWYHDFEGGRAWYTAMGHTTCSYSEQPFLDHILGGIMYAAEPR